MGEKIIVMKKLNINCSKAFSFYSLFQSIYLQKKNSKIRNINITKRNIIRGLLMMPILILANETCSFTALADKVMLTSITDETLAYRFNYPTTTSKGELFHFIF